MGEPADSATYILKRNAKLMVVNEGGKEAVVALFAPVTFWEKGAWRVRRFAWGTATVIVPATDFSRDVGRRDWFNPLTGEFVHEQVQEARVC